jgi:hypothetical protein
MLGRYILIAIGILAFIWTCFVAFDLIDKKNELAPQQIFGKEDSLVMIVHRSEEVNWDVIEQRTGQKGNSLLSRIKKYPAELKTIYISSNRNHLLFESSVPWSKKMLAELLEQTGKVEFQGQQKVLLESYTGRIYRNRLYLFEKDYSTELLEANWSNFDRKASLSIADLSTKTPTLTDIYFKENGLVEYVSGTAKGLSGKKIDDQELFSRALPKNIKSYHFLEKDYLLSSDAIFKSSPMKDWIENGLVRFRYEHADVIITDYLQSQDPVNSLFDFTQKDPLNQSYGFFQNIELMKGFPENVKKGFYAYSMDDFVVISSDQQSCEKIVAEFRLGNTLSQSPEELKRIFGKLPARVSEREVNETLQVSFSVYKNVLIETRFPSTSNTIQVSEKNDDNNTQADSYKFGAAIHDFIVTEGKGNITAVTKNSLIRQYKNGKKGWERNIASEPIGELQQVDFRGMKYTLVTTKNGVHLFDQNGNSPDGFPIIVADRQLTCKATVYTWKNKSYLIATNSNSEMLLFDQNAKRISTINTGLTQIKQAPEVWVSQRKLYIGINDGKTFKMFDAESRREYRRFELPGNSIAVKRANELIHFSLSEGTLLKIDQKGNRVKINSNLNTHKLFGINSDGEQLKFILTTDNSVLILDESGKTLLNISSKAKEFEFVNFNDMNSSNSILAIVDGMENDVYLHSPNGDLIGGKSLEGSLKASVQRSGGILLITSVVDDFIVQYTLN